MRYSKLSNNSAPVTIKQLLVMAFAMFTVSCGEKEETIRERAEAGDPEAQNDLGVIYTNVKEMPPNYRTAVKWYRKAAEQGNAEGQSRLAYWYSLGMGGLPQSDTKAAKWYRKAAEQGDENAKEWLLKNVKLKYEVKSDSVTITSCVKNASGELIIPAIIEGKPVTSIGESAFRDYTSLTSITIPDSVTSIGRAAFESCTNLTSITIPDSVTSIGSSAFRACTSLTSITIPDGVTSIGNSVFASCSSLPSITIPDSVTSIGDYTFYNCTNLTGIIFQGVAPAVGIDAFSNTPDGAVAVVSIEDQASFGDLGADWNGLTVNMSVSDMITALNAQNAAVATARTAGRGDVTNNPTSYNLVTQTSYNTVIAERDARPTAEQLANVEAERDARFTEDQINAMTTDPTIGRNAAGNMQVDISFIHSTDLQTFTPFAVNPAWVSVVDGKIALEFPPSDENTFFYRLGVQ